MNNSAMITATSPNDLRNMQRGVADMVSGLGTALERLAPREAAGSSVPENLEQADCPLDDLVRRYTLRLLPEDFPRPAWVFVAEDVAGRFRRDAPMWGSSERSEQCRESSMQTYLENVRGIRNLIFAGLELQSDFLPILRVVLERFQQDPDLIRGFIPRWREQRP